MSEKPRKGVYSIWEVAPEIADSLLFDIADLIPEGIEKIECRFLGLTPVFTAIVHSKKGRKFAIFGNSEYLEEEDYREMGFDYDKYSRISDSIACVYSVYIIARSEISKEEFEKNYKLSERAYKSLKEKYNDYTADFTTEERLTFLGKKRE